MAEMLQDIGTVFSNPEIIIFNVICPVVIAVLKWVWYLFTRDTILVPKYQGKMADRYMYIGMLKLWKITVMPVGFCMALLLSSYFIIGEVDIKELVMATAVLLSCIVCLWILLCMLGKKKLRVILKIVVATAIGSMLFFSLCVRLGTNGRYILVTIVCGCVLLTCLELFLYEVGYYDGNVNAILQLVEYILSMGVVVVLLKFNESWMGIILVLISAVVALIDALNWRKSTEPDIEKQIVIEIDSGNFDKYVTDGAIKISSRGYLYFRDNQKRRVRISQDSIQCITFDYPSKLVLWLKVEKLIVSGNSSKKMDQEWYVKAILNDWLWLSYSEGDVTKNIVYPAKQVSWVAKSDKRQDRRRLKDRYCSVD